MTSSKTSPGDLDAQLYLRITDGRVDVENDALHPGAMRVRGPIRSQEDDIATAETTASPDATIDAANSTTTRPARLRRRGWRDPERGSCTHGR
jgi:hypothetical protein